MRTSSETDYAKKTGSCAGEVGACPEKCDIWNITKTDLNGEVTVLQGANDLFFALWNTI